MFKRIDHVEIVTDQLHRTVQFYTEVLGFTVNALDRIESSGLGVPINLVYLDLGAQTDNLLRVYLLDKGAGGRHRRQRRGCASLA
jgi:catechol 2,3-dioxygenase-like lactoylglutathione lyase family enzyme